VRQPPGWSAPAADRRRRAWCCWETATIGPRLHPGAEASPGGARAAGRDQVRVAGPRSDRLPGPRPRATRPGGGLRELRPRRHRLGGPWDRPVLPHAGVLLAADPVRPAWDGCLRPGAAGRPAPMGGLCGGTGGGPGPGRLTARRDHGPRRCRPDGAVVCGQQTGTDQRAGVGELLGQVGGRRRLPDRDPPGGRAGDPRPDRPTVGHRCPGRDVGGQPSR
jgi:hypothetical protein